MWKVGDLEPAGRVVAGLGQDLRTRKPGCMVSGAREVARRRTA
jgi:hypothetical protein